MSAAAALDAADGVIDGRHFGRPIVQAGAPSFGFAQPQYFGGATFAQPAFGGFSGYGATVAQPAFFGGASSTAAALDAADGVIDGRHFGRPIVQAGAPSFVQAGPSFVQAPSVYGAQSFGTYGAPAFGTTYGASTFGAPTFVGGASSTAAALDAADGVIDGRHFGRPIVQAGAPTFAAGGLVPYTGVQAAPTFIGGAPQAFGGQYFGGQRFVGGYNAPVFGGAVPVQQYGGYGYPQQFAGAGSRAAALDAADGVIDGRYYGRQIVQRR